MSSVQPRSGAHAKPRRRAPWIIALALAAVALFGAIALLTAPADESPVALETPVASPHSSPDPSQTAESDVSAPASTPVDATPGVITQTPPIPMQKAVALDDAAEPVAGLIAHVDKLEAVQGQASARGEVAGPAVRFEITLANTTAASVSLANAVVNVDSGSAHTPASVLAEPGGRPLPGSLAPGKSAAGVYIFTVPLDERDSIRILLDYSVDVPIVVFEGQGPR